MSWRSNEPSFMNPFTPAAIHATHVYTIVSLSWLVYYALAYRFDTFVFWSRDRAGAAPRRAAHNATPHDDTPHGCTAHAPLAVPERRGGTHCALTPHLTVQRSRAARLVCDV